MKHAAPTQIGPDVTNPPDRSPIERQWRATVALTLAAYVLMQILYVTATPIQQMILPDHLPQRQPASVVIGIGPDEREHFVYLLSLANLGAFPRITPQWRTSPDQYVSYQAQHPPLFYAGAALAYQGMRGLAPTTVWYLLRAFCALCGGVVIALAARAAHIAFPEQPRIGLIAAPAIAFLPMFGHMMGNLSNEPLAMVFTAWAWLQLVRLARNVTPLTPAAGVVLGLTLGLATETRQTAMMWLPACAMILWYCARRQPKASLLPLSLFALCFLGLALPWFVHNQLTYGTPFVRPNDRPMLQHHPLVDFLADPGFPQVALLTALWYASTPWLPFWLVQFYVPGGLRAAGAWQALFLILEVFLLLALFLHSSRARREAVPPDPAGRLLLWAAGSVIAFCLLTLLQQQLYSDWQVLYYPGRYLVAAAPAGGLLFAFVWNDLFRRTPRIWLAVASIALVMLAFDLYTVALVRQFYAGHPRQPIVQRL